MMTHLFFLFVLWTLHNSFVPNGLRAQAFHNNFVPSAFVPLAFQNMFVPSGLSAQAFHNSFVTTMSAASSSQQVVYSEHWGHSEDDKQYDRDAASVGIAELTNSSADTAEDALLDHVADGCPLLAWCELSIKWIDTSCRRDASSDSQQVRNAFAGFFADESRLHVSIHSMLSSTGYWEKSWQQTTSSRSTWRNRNCSRWT